MRSLPKLVAWSLGSLALLAVVAVASARLAPALAASPRQGATGPMALTDLVFYALAALAVGGAAGVALSRNILYTSLALLFSLMGVAGLYVFLSADFVAVAQVLVYIGGVLVLILFAVMLTNRIGDVNISNPASAGPEGHCSSRSWPRFSSPSPVAVPWRVREAPARARPRHRSATRSSTLAACPSSSPPSSCSPPSSGPSSSPARSSRPSDGRENRMAHVDPLSLPRRRSAALRPRPLHRRSPGATRWRVLMGVELLLNAANVNFVAFNRYVVGRPRRPGLRPLRHRARGRRGRRRPRHRPRHLPHLQDHRRPRRGPDARVRWNTP